MWETATVVSSIAGLGFAACAVILAVLWAREIRGHGQTELLLAATEAAREAEAKAARELADRRAILELAIAERDKLLVEKDEMIAKFAASHPGAGRAAFDKPPLPLPPIPVPGGGK